MKEGSDLRNFFVQSVTINLVSTRFEPVARFEGVARYLYRYNKTNDRRVKNGAYNSNKCTRTMASNHGVGRTYQ